MTDGAHGPASRDWQVGIDFGTAFSKAAATRTVPGPNGRPVREVRPLHVGAVARWKSSLLAPSAIFLNRQLVHFGPNAHAKLREEGNERRELLQSFKTMLGANDFEIALNFTPTRPVDPDGTFRMRDLMVLYLAYLLVLIDESARGALGAGEPRMRLRYSRPGWIPHRSEAAREAMARLFQEAHNTRIALGESILAPEGLPYKIARDALAEGRVTLHGTVGIDGGVFEASAVAVCHFLDPNAPDHIVIVDIGAGTTDVAGLVRDAHSGEARVIPQARQTINVAGDQFDRALMQFVIAKAKFLRTREDQMALWRELLPVIREYKEVLFEHGEVEVRFDGQSIIVRARDLERANDFKWALDQITGLFHRGLDEMVRAARADGARRVGVALSGGGSNLPPIIEMARKKAQRTPNMSVELMPTTPKWANDLNSTTEFTRVFSQLCVAFGTAISAPGQLQNALI